MTGLVVRRHSTIKEGSCWVRTYCAPGRCTMPAIVGKLPLKLSPPLPLHCTDCAFPFVAHSPPPTLLPYVHANISVAIVLVSPSHLDGTTVIPPAGTIVAVNGTAVVVTDH